MHPAKGPTAPSNPRDTPAMRQHARFKALHPDCLLLFRIGDFYEMFDDDAVKASKAIGLTLTQRTAGVPMAGVPYHQLDTYLRRFIAAGFRVAVCEQVQDVAHVKAGQIVERAVTRVLTPGTLVDQSLLADDRPNHLACVAFVDAPGPAGRADTAAVAVAVAVAELSTGELSVFWCPADALVDELSRRAISEVLFAETADLKPPPRVAGVLGALSLAGTPRPQWHFRLGEAREALLAQFGVATLEAFGLPADDALAIPAGVIIRYLQATQAPRAEGSSPTPPTPSTPSTLAHIRPPRREEPTDRVLIDASTLRSLEVAATIRAASGLSPEVSHDGSLLGVFLGSACKSPCRTGMGKRLLRDWLLRPLAALEPIRTRHDRVAALAADRRFSGELADAVTGVQDVPRLAGRVALGRAGPRDIVALGASVARVAAIDTALVNVAAFAPARAALAGGRPALEALAATIAEHCVENPPHHLREGGLIRDGVDAALDEARLLRRDAGSWLAAYQARLIAEHNLPTLKVAYNKVAGYYIELSKGAAERAPAIFHRRQTLTNAERYLTPELKDFEDKVANAEARALEREQALFAGLCEAAQAALGPIHAFAETVAELDALQCLADKAADRRWVRPEMVGEPGLDIRQGRHPVLDELLAADFVPNDVALGECPESATGPVPRLALITGPNMAGKSTYIRQTALLVLLAHAGSFIPAEAATIGLADRVFARVGADDALHAGQSTFMVEMTETAAILHHATDRSLVVLDEIGRGTSTLDGLSLAWAVTESLAGIEVGRARGRAGTPARPRTLFATHYHELTRLADDHPHAVANLHVAVREWPAAESTPADSPDAHGQIVFLHRILPGRTDRSYGLHVARLAGIPEATIRRARVVLESLSVEHAAVGAAAPPSLPPPPVSPGDGELNLFTSYVPHPAVDALREIKLDTLSPIQAFDELRRLKDLSQSAGAGA